MLAPLELSQLAGQFSYKLPRKDRRLNVLRPFICPFHIMLDYVAPGSRVLDIGCGLGLWLYLLSRLGRIDHGTGIEVDAAKVELAKSLRTKDDPLEFQHLSAGQAWSEGPFDCLTLIDVLHHVPRREQKAFMERIAVTGARRVVFKDIDPESRGKALMNTLHDLVLSHERPNYCPAGEVASWLTEMGFRIAYRGRHDMVWYGHYLIVAER